MQIFTMARNVTGKGKDLKTEYQFAGNVTLMGAQQMLTEVIIASSKAQASKEAKVQKDAPKDKAVS